MDKKLLKKYRSGECTNKEQQYVLQWISNPDNTTQLKQWMQEDWVEQDDTSRPEVALEHVWESIERQTNAGSDLEFRKSAPKPLWLFPVRNTILRVAASIILILLAGVGGYRYFFGKSRDIVYQTQYGEVKHIVLPDSSTVVLNSNSILRYPAKWDRAHKREVWLEGEGFFTIQHKSNNQKFLVHTTDHFDIEVVGTQFSIFREKEHTRIVLNNGKIKLHLHTDVPENAHDLDIKPGELIEYNDKDQQLTRRYVNPEIYSSWKDSQLIFEETPLSEVALRLERSYGLSVVLDKSIQDKRLTGRMNLMNLDVLLDAMSSTFNLKITQKKDSIIIHPNP